jgi:predicted dehydrogenase
LAAKSTLAPPTPEASTPPLAVNNKDNFVKLRIGLIELGPAWQTRHRPALRMLQDRFDVRAICCGVAKKAEPVANEFQADLLDGYRTMVSRGDIDAVMILERSWQGWLPVLAACDAGKAVYWAGDPQFDPVADAEVYRRVDESGIAFMAELPRRFAPATLRLKELIATKLGAPRLIFCHRRLSVLPSKPGGICDSDPLAESRRELVELIDWCRYVVSREPSAVTALVHHLPGGDSATPKPQRERDYQCLSLRFAAAEPAPEVMCQLSCGQYIPAAWHEAINFRPPSAMQICCEHGVAFIDLPSTLVWFDEAGRHLESLETEMSVGEQMLTQFHRTVTSLVRRRNDLDDAFRAASVLYAADQSSAEGRQVLLPLGMQPVTEVVKTLASEQPT